MEDIRKPELYKAVVAEFIGTFFLTLAALISDSPFVVALTLGVFVYAIGDISGCNINPVVTVGLVTIRRLPILRGAYYIIAQILGALLARLLAPLVESLPMRYSSGNLFAEFFGSAFLILTVMAVSDKYIPKSSSGVAIGAALAAGLATSKGILNPAIAIAMGLPISPAVWATLLGGIVFALLSRLYGNQKAAQQPSAPTWSRAQSSPGMLFTSDLERNKR